METEEVADDTEVAIVEAPGEFVPSKSARGARYRVVRVSFNNVIHSAVTRVEDPVAAVNEISPFPENAFDWSEVPLSNNRFSSLSEYRAAVDRYLAETSTVPNPRMYELGRSPLMAERGVEPPEFKHLILVGDDEFFDVVAESWRWEPGQAT